MKSFLFRPKYRWILILAVIVIFAIVLYVLNDYRLDIDESEVVSVSFYNESCISKKIVTNAEDIRLILKTMNSLHSWGKFDMDDLPDGGTVYDFVFDFGNTTRYIAINVVSHDGDGFLFDGDTQIKVSGLNLEALWDSLDYEEIEAKPGLELPQYQ